MTFDVQLQLADPYFVSNLCMRAVHFNAREVCTDYFFYFCIIVRNETDVILFHFQFFAPRQYWNTRK